MSGIGASGFILILILALVLFGPKKLPELGRAVGHTLREFKSATKGLTSDDEDDKDKNQVKIVKAEIQQPTQSENIDREKLEKEIRERIERERLEAKADQTKA